MDPSGLLERLDAIGRALERSGHALALIGLGSVGLERERLDEYSDLDFFVIVEPGHKQRYLHDLGWLSDVHPVAYRYRNTPDGHKALFADGIFCEFAVFEPDELPAIPFAPGRIVWKRPGVPETLSRPATQQSGPPQRDLDWLLGEALTNLLVGLARDKRGERLSALGFIQGSAVDRVLELADRIEAAKGAARDPFSPERRFERRYPALAPELGSWLRGYGRNRESALAILAFLERHFEVSGAIAAAIRALCAGPELVAPSAELRDSYRALVREFEAASEPLVPFPLRFPHDDFPAFLERLAASARGEGLPDGFVPHTTFWLVSDSDVVGVSNLRHALTPALRREGGHIGYGVRPSARGRGFGREILRQTLARARGQGLAEALLTCAKSNVASVRTILANGGVFDSEEFIPERGEIVQRYWIRITAAGS